MPREAMSLVREGGFRNAEKFFILAYEGTVTEKRYFEGLRESTLFTYRRRRHTTRLGIRRLSVSKETCKVKLRHKKRC